MRDKKTEEEQGDATTSSLEKALQPWNQFSHSEPTYLHGSPLEESLFLENEANLEIEAVSEFLVKQEACLELLEKVSDLERWKRKYKKSDPVETWSSRWVCSLVAYLFPADRREEWLGDLYELNREMIHKGYPRWVVNTINLGRTLVLILSAMQIKLSDLISLKLEKGK